MKNDISFSRFLIMNVTLSVPIKKQINQAAFRIFFSNTMIYNSIQNNNGNDNNNKCTISYVQMNRLQGGTARVFCA